MKGFLVFFLATAIVSVSKADYKSILDINRGWNTSNIPSSRIINGQPASLGQFPYQVRLIMTMGNIIGAACGGSIIALNWVLTAAHCIVFLSAGVQVTYTSGTIEAGSVEAGSASAQKRTVDSAHPHSGYIETTLVNDIGVVHTSQPFTFGSNVNYIALVAYNPNANSDDYVGQTITVSGFGYTDNDGPVSPNLMYTQDLVSILFSDCQAQYTSPLPSTSFCVQDTVGDISAICSGDSGGPGTLGGKQIGIVSYGSSGGCDEACQGFTNVAPFVQWIEVTTGLDL